MTSCFPEIEQLFTFFLSTRSFFSYYPYSHNNLSVSSGLTSSVLSCPFSHISVIFFLFLLTVIILPTRRWLLGSLLIFGLVRLLARPTVRRPYVGHCPIARLSVHTRPVFLTHALLFAFSQHSVLYLPPCKPTPVTRDARSPHFSLHLLTELLITELVLAGSPHLVSPMAPLPKAPSTFGRFCWNYYFLLRCGTQVGLVDAGVERRSGNDTTIPRQR